MMVTFISQCQKKALVRSRRVLDSFADRIGDNSWQTIITKEGLCAVRKLLRQTASKNTAVSCHWIRSRSRSDLVWIVGNSSRFNTEGLIPSHRTQRRLITDDWQNNWQHADSIQILAVLAALLHDIGKASIGFQNKLSKKAADNNKLGDPYRHEWISLRLFIAMIKGCKDDKAWLIRLTTFSTFTKENPNWLSSLGPEHLIGKSDDLSSCPPLAQFLGWLIASHHRLPFYDVNYRGRKKRISHRESQWYQGDNITELYKDLLPAEHWVKNPKSAEDLETKGQLYKQFWSFPAMAMDSNRWQSELSRWCKKALSQPSLFTLAQAQDTATESKSIADPFIMHLARLCLMIGDHNFSSRSAEESQQVKGDQNFIDRLAANTDRKSGDKKQALDQHLIGVARMTARFSRLLPRLKEELPHLGRQPAFFRPTSNARFKWQDRAYNLSKGIAKDSREHGFFGINMASTGRGKTLANARIAYALSSDTQTARFTIALGLRILTLQTGDALRQRMGLSQEEIAILVGGKAQRTLYEHKDPTRLEDCGSESLKEWIQESVHTEATEHLNHELGTVVENPKAKELLFTPIVSCTIDHLISASESQRGGRHIAPLLRLLSSDLILDEPDDFDQEDLPALARLVHFAGLFGSRVLLSSATLTPDLVTGLFDAYKAGREIWNQQQGLKQPHIICAWFDEYSEQKKQCADKTAFNKHHQKFCKKRAGKLQQESVRHQAAILSMEDLEKNTPSDNNTLSYSNIGQTIIDAAQELHQQHHDTNSLNGQTASVGLIRIAHISDLVKLAQTIHSDTGDNTKIHLAKNTKIHLVCYHSRQLLVLRNQLETQLDRILKRSNDSSLFDHLEINQAIQKHDSEQQIKHHIFIVLATPIAEVGRDHDYDWAIIEPSSIRSIVQLAGRVWRHRPEKVADSPNLLILGCNLKALSLGEDLGINKAVFTHPGFENENGFLLKSHRIKELILEDQLCRIDSSLRIQRADNLEPDALLVDLEHDVLAKLLNLNGETNFVSDFWLSNSANRATAHLQKISPFRQQDGIQEEFVCQPDEDEPSGYRFRYAELAWEAPDDEDNQNNLIRYQDFNTDNSSIQTWLESNPKQALEALSEILKKEDLNYLARRYALIQLDQKTHGWHFHPYLGFFNP